MSVRDTTFVGFANPGRPDARGAAAWAYHPEAVPLDEMPPDWDLLVAGDVLIATLFELAMDRQCPARRFALHCLYIYAADGVRTQLASHPQRRLRKCVEQARGGGRRADGDLGAQLPGADDPARAVRLPRVDRGRPGPPPPLAWARIIETAV